MKTKEQVHNWNMEWNHSKRGVCYRLWHHNVRNSKLRGHTPPKYTRDELEEWVLSNPAFEKLYTTWVNNNYEQKLSVSIDRLDNSKGYSFDNIELVSFETNYQRSHEGFRNKSIHNPTLLNGGHRAVTVFTLSGKPMQSFISMSEAARYFSENRHQAISKCCLEEKLYWRKYLWCYADQFEHFVSTKLQDVSARAIKEFILKNSAVIQYSLEGEYIAEYSTITQAAKMTGLTFNLVSKWIKGESTRIKPTFIFTLKELEID